VKGYGAFALFSHPYPPVQSCWSWGRCLGAEPPASAPESLGILHTWAHARGSPWSHLFYPPYCSNMGKDSAVPALRSVNPIHAHALLSINPHRLAHTRKLFPSILSKQRWVWFKLPPCFLIFFKVYLSHKTGQQTQLGNTLQHKLKIIRAGRSSFPLCRTVIGPSIYYFF